MRTAEAKDACKDMQIAFESKRVAAAGGSRGIGRPIARGFSADGGHLSSG